MLLEIFVHNGCISKTATGTLIEDIRSACPDLTIRTCSVEWAEERMRELDLMITPAFVFNGEVVAVGVPRKEWLLARLVERGLRTGGCSEERERDGKG